MLEILILYLYHDLNSPVHSVYSCFNHHLQTIDFQVISSNKNNNYNFKNTVQVTVEIIYPKLGKRKKEMKVNIGISNQDNYEFQTFVAFPTLSRQPIRSRKLKYPFEIKLIKFRLKRD